MNFSLIFIKSTNQIILKSFSKSEVTRGHIIDLDSIKDHASQGILLPKEQESDELMSLLQEEHKFTPIKSVTLTENQFEELDYEQGFSLFEGQFNNWVLHNNISAISNIFKLQHHLTSLWPNDRTGFFEELWFVIRSNLGCSNLTIIYNDIRRGEGEREKNKLIQSKISGTRIPNPLPGDELDKNLMENYKNDFNNFLSIKDFNQEKGELVLTATIKESPILIMANIYQISGLQKAFISALFEGLQ